jgi:hypothetical protein
VFISTLLANQIRGLRGLSLISWINLSSDGIVDENHADFVDRFFIRNFGIGMNDM